MLVPANFVNKIENCVSNEKFWSAVWTSLNNMETVIKMQCRLQIHIYS